jgi:hypothetical protein
MARIDKHNKISGSILNLTFYEMGGKSYVRAKSPGLSREKIKNNPRLAKTRAVIEEFGRASSDGKLIRQAVLSSIHGFSDCRVCSRITQGLFRIIERDLTNPRGKRTVSEGLKSAEGKAIIKYMNFNIEAELGNVLHAAWTIDSSTYTISIPNFVPSKSLKIPKEATHFSIRGAAGYIDFTNRKYRLQPTNEVSSGKVKKIVPVNLTPLNKPEGTGYAFFILSIKFFKGTNNALQSLNEGKHDSLAIIEVL